ncbi:MAG: 50S ribosomal protein L21 [Planctomycetota bacterium]|nr:50S ribosomal protein L21 [Planctomycetota bacterium]MDA1105084.1 50S ribosomal protein L21 [Planctomycetota bacterium]
MYAIIEDSGTQIKVSQGDTIEVDLRDLPGGAESVVFERVLAIGTSDGTPARVGSPYLAGASVRATILEESRARKVVRAMYKRRKGTRRAGSHRQGYLKVRIDGITG